MDGNNKFIESIKSFEKQNNRKMFEDLNRKVGKITN